MQFQITEIEFDLDQLETEEMLPKSYIAVEFHNLVGTVWEADNEEDLIEEISCASGWCVKSINYRVGLDQELTLVPVNFLH